MKAEENGYHTLKLIFPYKDVGRGINHIGSEVVNHFAGQVKEEIIQLCIIIRLRNNKESSRFSRISDAMYGLVIDIAS